VYVCGSSKKHFMAIIRGDITIQVNNNRKKTRGRRYSIVKKKNGETVKLQNSVVYTRVD
jgi:hypothetical protein